MIGIPFFLLTTANISQALSNTLKYVYVRMVNFIKKTACKKDANCENETSNSMEVPLLIAVLIFFTYTVIGAYLFNYLENWPVGPNSIYFTFVTLTTIGFGDLVPGTHNSSTHDQNLVITIIYIIIGMAMLVMFFDLIQKNIKKNVKLIGTKLIKKKDKLPIASPVNSIDTNISRENSNLPQTTQST